MKILKRIDKFYIILALILAFLAIPMIFAAKSIFSAFLTVYEIDNLDAVEVRINKSKLDESVSRVYDEEVPPLVVRETSIVPPIEKDTKKVEENVEVGR